MKLLFAHADEVHEDIVETTRHGFEVDPLVATLIIIAVAVLVVTVVQWVFKKPNITLVVALGLLFVIGVFAYSISALFSAVAIVLGFILSLVLAFGGIRANK